MAEKKHTEALREILDSMEIDVTEFLKEVKAHEDGDTEREETDTLDSLDVSSGFYM
tara:strand:- start:621 stop:788 length:168 start_codon:yes stop_codon:yes gene_type:complete